MIFKTKIKPVYLLFLTIPLLYLLLWNSKPIIPSSDAKLPDYLYFSVRTSKPATLRLIANKDTLNKWDINSAGYKNLQFVGKINDSAGINIIVNNLNINDTISFLGFNLYRNHQLYSLYEGLNKYCTARNATLIENNGVLNAIIQQSGKAVSFHIKPSFEWETNDNGNSHRLMIALIFVVAFIIIIILQPSTRNFIVSLAISLLVMFMYFQRDTNSVGRITMMSSTTMKGAEIYYNSNPFFTPDKRYSSVEDTNSYSVPLNLETNGYFRCDVFESMHELMDFKIKINAGIFSSTYNIASMPQGALVVNDFMLHGKNYYTTGNDPFILFTSNYFIKKIQWLLFLEHNVFLFISLLVLLILLIIHPVGYNKNNTNKNYKNISNGVNRFIKGVNNLLNKIKFRAAYFFFLLIPLTYCLIYQPWINKAPSKNPDHLYFSAHTSKPSVISLYYGNNFISSCKLNSNAFKYIPCNVQINDSAAFYLKVDSLKANDTLSLLSINLYHDDHVYSLFNKNEQVCTIRNATLLHNPGEVNATVKSSDAPLIVKLLPLNALKKDNPNHKMGNIIILVFFISFIIVLIISPQPKYFIISCITASLMMFIYFWVCDDIGGQVTISTDTPVKRVDFFYSSNPVFSSKRDNIVKKGTYFFKTPALLKDYYFFRCDVDENTKSVKNFHVCTKAGLMRNDFNYSKMPLEKILFNDLIKRGDTYYIKGDDPYFVLTTSSQVKSIKWMVLLRQNLFFFLTMLLFLVLLFASRLAKRYNLTSFFFIVVFIAIVSFGLILRLFNSENIILLSERRNAYLRPYFQLDSTMVFLKQTDNYIKDQIPGRNNIVTMNNLIDYSIFRQVINNQVVLFGKDGWMFFIGGLARENYENQHPLTQQELKKMMNVLVARRDWLKERGIRFYLVFPPSSHLIYEEEIGPRLWHYNKKPKLDQLIEYLKLHTDLDIIDIYNPIMEEKKKSTTELCYRQNGHWNYYGAYVAYNAIIKYMKKDFANIGEPLATNNIKWTHDDMYYADFLRLLAIDKFYSTNEYYPLPKNRIITDTLYPTYIGFSSPAPPFIFVTNKKTYPSMIINGDSYAGALLSFLPNNFSRIIGLWTPLFYPDIIEKEKPDIVMQEMADYTISFILNPNPPIPKMKDTINVNTK